MRTLTVVLSVVVPWGVALHASGPQLLVDSLVGVAIGVALAVAYVVALRRLSRDRDPRDTDRPDRGSSGS